MKRICLVACSKTKSDKPSAAKELYTSALFRKSAEYAQSHCDTWYILSAKYGLVEPDREIAPYEKTLNKMGVSERRGWSERVLRDLLSEARDDAEFVFLAGARYRELLVPELEAKGCRVRIPMSGMSLGNQLKWLNAILSTRNSQPDLERFYALLERLESGLSGKPTLADCDATLAWPQRGLYILFEPGECRSSRSKCQRVVRVGTHAVSRGAKSTLWGRLRTHKGTENGLGSHRSSIFRLHVGRAIMAKERLENSALSWGKGQSADRQVRENEVWLERRVSEWMSNIQVLWLSVLDEPSAKSDRAFLERNMIGLFSTSGRRSDPPSPGWLGSYSPRKEIRDSGLWNLDHLHYKCHPEFLNVLEHYVIQTCGASHCTRKSLAPPDWPRWNSDQTNSDQTDLFGGK